MNVEQKNEKTWHGSKGKVRRQAELGLLLAVAVIMGYVEALVPVSAGVPGVKLGLANCAVLFVLYRYGAKAAMAVSILRTVVIAALFGSFAMLLYSLCGALCSIMVMAVMRRKWRGKIGEKEGHADRKEPFFSIYGVSAAGGVMHNIAQLAVAFAVLGTGQAWKWWICVYLPLLMVCGLAAGLVNALIAGALLGRSAVIK